jgi:hypothetical protein
MGDFAPDAYAINLHDESGTMTLIDIPGGIAAHEPWFNRTLPTVNESVVRLGIIEGDFHRHSHENRTSPSWCRGRARDRLPGPRHRRPHAPHQGFTVPRGVVHRTRRRTAILMVESAGAILTGD